MRTSKSCTRWAMRRNLRGACTASRTSRSPSRSSASCRAASIRWPRRPPAPAASASASAGRSAASCRGVFAVAMSQISSAYPTAGGLYHWGSILGNRFTGWVTAWLNLLGLITVLGAINVGTWTFFVGAFGRRSASTNTLTNQTIFLVDHHRRAGADQPLRHRADGEADRLLRLSDLRTADPARDRLPDFAPRLGLRPAVHLPQLLGRCRRRRLAGGFEQLGVPARPVAADLHDHRL